MPVTDTIPTFAFARWVSLALLAGCAKPGVEVQRLSNGASQITCQAPLWKCLLYVDDFCKGASYEVLYAKDDQHLFGVDQSQVEGHTSEAQVHCLGPHQKPFPEPAAPDPAAASAPSAASPSGGAPSALAPISSSVPATSAPAPSASATSAWSPVVAAPPPAAAPRVCVPGATQACVGAGACQGGQACRADGSGFGACDCGAPR